MAQYVEQMKGLYKTLLSHNTVYIAVNCYNNNFGGDNAQQQDIFC